MTLDSDMSQAHDATVDQREQAMTTATIHVSHRKVVVDVLRKGNRVYVRPVRDAGASDRHLDGEFLRAEWYKTRRPGWAWITPEAFAARVDEA
jgi:hypothetical protein